MKRLQLSTVDLVGSPTQAQVHAGIEFIQENAKNGHSVYVHCKAGRTRSATLVACYLMKVSPVIPLPRSMSHYLCTFQRPV